MTAQICLFSLCSLKFILVGTVARVTLQCVGSTPVRRRPPGAEGCCSKRSANLRNFAASLDPSVSTPCIE
jgi:hypothetical protein